MPTTVDDEEEKGGYTNLTVQSPDEVKRKMLIRVGASKIRQERAIFQEIERELKERCNKTSGTEFETSYREPTKDETNHQTTMRRRWMRRRLKKYDDDQERLKREEE